MKRDLNDYFREITQNMYGQVDEKLLKYSLVKGQAQLLLIIKDNNGCTQKELANYFNVKYSSMSERIDKLVQLGYITRIHEDGNFKYNKIYITATGKSAATQCRRILKEIEKKLFKGINKKDVATFEDVLMKVTSNSNNL